MEKEKLFCAVCREPIPACKRDYLYAVPANPGERVLVVCKNCFSLLFTNQKCSLCGRLTGDTIKAGAYTLCKYCAEVLKESLSEKINVNTKPEIKPSSEENSVRETEPSGAEVTAALDETIGAQEKQPPKDLILEPLKCTKPCPPTTFAKLTVPQNKRQKLHRLALIMIKPHAYGRREEIFEFLKMAGFEIEALKEGLLQKDCAECLYREHRGKGFYDRLIASVTGPVAVALLKYTHSANEKADAVTLLRTLVGPTDPEEARRRAPETIRAKWGEGLPHNAVHASADTDAFIREAYIFFPRELLKLGIFA